jgi:ATP/ADP translocase
LIGQFSGNCISLLQTNALYMNPESWRIIGAIMAVIGGFWTLACLSERERLQEHKHLQSLVLSGILLVTGLLIIIISMANIERKMSPRQFPIRPWQKESTPEDRPTGAGHFAELSTRFFI